MGGFAENREYQDSQIIHRDIQDWPGYATVRIHLALPDHLRIAGLHVIILRAVEYAAVAIFLLCHTLNIE